MKNYRASDQNLEIILASNNIELFIDKFYKDILLTLPDDQIIMLIFKVNYNNNDYKSFSKLIYIVKDHRFKKIIKDQINKYISIYFDEYSDNLITDYLFEYVLISKERKNYSLVRDHINDYLNTNLLENPVLVEENGFISTLKDFNFLPKTMDITSWYPYVEFNDKYTLAWFQKDQINYSFKFIKNNIYYCTLKDSHSGEILLKFKDEYHLKNLSLDNFNRTIYKIVKKESKINYYKDQMFEFNDGKIIAFEKDLNRFFFIAYNKRKKGNNSKNNSKKIYK